ncbi:MFS transporter [Bradyrhizobium genomosp. III]|uniref:MFS transporter n=1 Tax=Bradyrhizobium genomosp. III TaxID=2683271 RepID=UPI0012F494B3|nr:MFS transporter [Bradyrhizobium sp. CCBAU 15615]
MTSAPWMTVFGVVLLSPVLPFMMKEFAQHPNAQVLVTTVLAGPALIIALLSPFVGVLVKRVGRKNALIAAIVVYAIAGSAPVWLNDIYHIIASRMIVGATEAVLTAVATVLTVDYFSGRARERWLAFQFGSASVIAVVAFGLGGALGGLAWGWHTPFLVYGFMILLLPLFIFFLWEPTQPIDRLPDEAKQSAPFPWLHIAPLWLMTMLSSIAFYVVPVQLSFVLNSRGLATPESIGLASAIANLGVPLGSYLFQAFARQPVMRLLTSGLVLFAAGFAIVAAAGTPQLTVVGAFIACIGGGLVIPLHLTWIMSRLPFEQRGLGAGGFSGAFYVGQFFSPIVAGILAAGAGGLDAAIGILGWTAAAAAIIALVYGLTRLGGTIRLELAEAK